MCCSGSLAEGEDLAARIFVFLAPLDEFTGRIDESDPPGEAAGAHHNPFGRDGKRVVRAAVREADRRVTSASARSISCSR